MILQLTNDIFKEGGFLCGFVPNAAKKILTTRPFVLNAAKDGCAVYAATFTQVMFAISAAHCRQTAYGLRNLNTANGKQKTPALKIQVTLTLTNSLKTDLHMRKAKSPVMKFLRRSSRHLKIHMLI